MFRPRRYLFPAVVVALVLVTPLVFLLRQPASAADRAVALVNGEPIAARDVEARLTRLLPNLSFHGKVPPERLLRLRRTAVDEIALDMLVFREAQATGRARIDAAAANAELAAVRARFGSETEYYQALGDSGFTEREFRATLIRDMVVERARRERLAANVRDAEVRAYYDANTAKFRRPEQIWLHEILIQVDPVGGPEAERARERLARALLGRLVSGEPFGPLARKHSEDPYRVKDGDLGWVHRGRIPATELEDAAFTAPVDRPALVRSDSGFHVFVVKARENERQLTLDEARPLIVERLAQRRSADAERRWHAALRASARIEILDAALRDAQPLELGQLPTRTTGTAAAARRLARSH
ncbi:MAG TPA: peptidylprolyl isomerase [Vicinamibacterales bacterium]|nr:peptidylprolyl isomerase [Vicinamibacterales bacterium]